MCLEMLKKYSEGSFKRGTYYSISGVRMDDPGTSANPKDGGQTPAFVFDFREASEHCVKASPRNSFKTAGLSAGTQAAGSTVVQHPTGFNMPRNYTARM